MFESAANRRRVAVLLARDDIDAAVAPHTFLREVAAVGASAPADRCGVYDCAALSLDPLVCSTGGTSAKVSSSSVALTEVP